MFAGSGTGGIPGSGSERSAIGLATCQASAGFEAERTGAARAALAWGVRGADTAGRVVGRKIVTPTTITATMATTTAPNHTVRHARWPAGQLILPMPIPPCTTLPMTLSSSPAWPVLTPGQGSKPQPVRPGIAGCDQAAAALCWF